MAKQRLIPSNIHSVPLRQFKLDRKSEYYSEDRTHMKQYQMLNFRELYSTYSNILLCRINNVEGQVISHLKHELREDYDSIFFNGKNSVTKYVIQEMENESTNENERQALRKLRENMFGSIGFLFTDRDVVEMRRLVESKGTFKIPSILSKAPEDLYLEKGDTGICPTKTGKFQQFNVPTKIYRGQIQITQRQIIIRKGQILGATELEFLKFLRMKPFKYGCKTLYIFEKNNYCIYSSNVLDYNLNESVYEAMNNMGSITLECNQLNQLSVLIELKKGIHSLLALQHESETIMKTIENDDVD